MASQRYAALWGRINSMGGADYQWTLGPEPSGNGWCFLGDSDDPEAAERELKRLFEESAEILAEKEEDRRKAEEDWANARIEAEAKEEEERRREEATLPDWYPPGPIKVQVNSRDDWKNA